MRVGGVLLGVTAGVSAATESICPPERGATRYGNHSIPKTIFYTGKTDAHLHNLTRGRVRWPKDYGFHFYDNEGVVRSMRRLSAAMASTVPGIMEAFKMLRPWAFRADLWRYCILWQCGGVYIDSKLALSSEPFETFLWNAGFNPQSLEGRTTPQLYSCRDDVASASMHRRSRLACLWQGLLIAEPRSEVLLQTIQFVVTKVEERWYPPVELTKMPWLFLTGPGAIAMASQVDHPDWRRHVTLKCRMTYTTNRGTRRGLRNPHLVGDWHGGNMTIYDDDLRHANFVANENLHKTQATNNYGIIFKAHLVYMDEEPPNSTKAA